MAAAPTPQNKQVFQQRLRPLWEKFLASGDAAELHQLILDSIVRRCEHSHPWLHRICDVSLEGQAYEVGRCVKCNEELSFEPREDLREEPGVPYALTGVGLRDWAENEETFPTKGPADWRHWLA